MKRILLSSLAVLLIVLVGIQFVPVDRTNPPVKTVFQGPEPVMQILRQSCYDCHSNQTTWPWYSYVAPVSWMVANHVEEGREELNFSDWAAHATDGHLMEEIYEEVEEGHMPEGSYLWMHPEAKVSEADLAILKDYFLPLAQKHGE